MSVSRISLPALLFVVGTLSHYVKNTRGFSPAFSNGLRSPVVLYSSADNGDGNPLESFMADVQTRLRIFQESKSSGDSTKLAIANVLAGEYDEESVRANVVELSKSAPCVMFTWQSSPSCKQAVEVFDKMGVEYKVVRLDDPWDEGNEMRAQLGKITNKTSVPSVWIGGEYAGGFDSGVGDDSPGLTEMAFLGTLRPKLQAAGALE